MFDTHLHTSFSRDSKMSSSDAIEQATAQGINIIITEHLDLDYPENPEEFVFDFDEYFEMLTPWRNDKVLLGVELGLRCECVAKNKEIISEWPFDEVIGSIHVVDGVDIYRPDFTRSNDKKVTYKRYFDIMSDCIKGFDDFDTLGHIDYICRYAVYQDPEIRLKDFYDEWTTICRVLVEKEKVLEINTRRLDNKEAAAALYELYQRYRELGGKYITIGSDAHRLSAIGTKFDIAWEMAEKLSLRPVYFKERKMHFDEK